MDEPVQLSSLTSHLICKLCSGKTTLKLSLILILIVIVIVILKAKVKLKLKALI